MKVYWLNGSLTAKPETPEEHRALNLLYQGARRTTLAEETRIAQESADISGTLEELSKMRLRETQMVPTGFSRNDFDN
jgi:hypothetical protein